METPVYDKSQKPAPNVQVKLNLVVENSCASSYQGGLHFAEYF